MEDKDIEKQLKDDLESKMQEALIEQAVAYDDALLDSLVEAMEKWVEERCDTDEWVNHIGMVGDYLEFNMALAAMSILHAVRDVNQSWEEMLGEDDEEEDK